MAKQRRRSASVGSSLVARRGRVAAVVEAGEAITKRFTCRTVRLRLTPPAYGPKQVKQTRQKLGASQAIVAEFLGASISAEQDWELGLKPPHGAACRLMDEIRRDPQYWIKWLQELATPVEVWT